MTLKGERFLFLRFLKLLALEAIAVIYLMLLSLILLRAWTHALSNGPKSINKLIMDQKIILL